MKVKALVWSMQFDKLRAPTPMGFSYEVRSSMIRGDFAVNRVHVMPDCVYSADVGRAELVTDAQSLAQADFERRWLECADMGG